MQIQCYALSRWSADGVRSSFSLRRLPFFAGKSGMTGSDGWPAQPAIATQWTQPHRKAV